MQTKCLGAQSYCTQPVISLPELFRAGRRGGRLQWSSWVAGGGGGGGGRWGRRTRREGYTECEEVCNGAERKVEEGPGPVRLGCGALLLRWQEGSAGWAAQHAVFCQRGSPLTPPCKSLAIVQPLPPLPSSPQNLLQSQHTVPDDLGATWTVSLRPGDPWLWHTQPSGCQGPPRDRRDPCRPAHSPLFRRLQDRSSQARDAGEQQGVGGPAERGGVAGRAASACCRLRQRAGGRAAARRAGSWLTSKRPCSL